MFNDLLFSKQDLKFKEFTSKLIPNIPISSVIGVKIPILRKISKDIVKSNNYQEFINNLPHKYLEEDILHGCIISSITDINNAIMLLDSFLPFVNNWCVCDSIKPISFKKNSNEALKYIKNCIKSNNTYKIRFGIVSLLTYFLDDNFNSSINKLVLNIKSNEYYINMAIAWYFSFAIIKQYDSTIYILENRLLDKWIHNKTIQKCIESYRISNEKKDYLRSLRIK